MRGHYSSGAALLAVAVATGRIAKPTHGVSSPRKSLPVLPSFAVSHERI